MTTYFPKDIGKSISEANGGTRGGKCQQTSKNRTQRFQSLFLHSIASDFVRCYFVVPKRRNGAGLEAHTVFDIRRLFLSGFDSFPTPMGEK